jgi:hypothetical protein
MAASEQGKRTIAQSCKYRSTARVVQHNEARTAIAAACASGPPDVGALKERAEFIRTKLADSEFEAEVNDHNGTYVSRFADVAMFIDWPDAAISAGKAYPAFSLSGVRIRFELDLSLQRTTKTNKIRTGGAMLRYAKSKALKPEVGAFQSAFAFGRLMELTEGFDETPEKKLCITLDGWTGLIHPAPGNSVYLYNEMGAACQAIAERWPEIKPPKGAILAP